MIKKGKQENNAHQFWIKQAKWMAMQKFPNKLANTKYSWRGLLRLNDDSCFDIKLQKHKRGKSSVQKSFSEAMGTNWSLEEKRKRAKDGNDKHFSKYKIWIK